MAKPSTTSTATEQVIIDKRPTHIVGIGASAGGLEALESFIKNLKPPTGLAFVIVQHLSPDYKSLMAELLAKYTDMPIYRIEDGMDLEKDSIYLISPRKNIKVFHGKLLSVDQEERHKGLINLPIDIFFQSLAQDLGERAIGIVLSGTGSDGTRGIRAIKECGGMTIAQQPETAKFDSIPKSAIATGLVDYVLPPEVMPQQLLNFVKHPFARHVINDELPPEGDNGLAKIFSLLRERHRVDFTLYKPSTIIRRIERRITVNQCSSLSQYTSFIEKHPHEVTTLFQEMLIGVTSFFRDEAVFNYVKTDIIPKILDNELNNSERQSDIRIWCAGCSTGEEAYTIAMLCADHIAAHKLPIHFKIFATDVDPIAIEKASIGIYPGSIAADVPPEFLSRYFIRHDEHFQIARELRECVVFAQHDLAKDPPFTNINLISCRNMLIYFQPALQKKVLELFNFSLKSSGILLLGTSETLGEMDSFFDPVNAKLKIFSSRGRQMVPSIPRHPSARSWSTMSPSPGRTALENDSLSRFSEERFYNRFIEALSNYRVLPLTLIANEQMQVSHVYGDSAEYLQYSHGKIVLDIGKVVTKALSIPVTTGLQKAIKTNQPFNLSNIRIHTLGGLAKNLQVQIFPIPNKGIQETMFAVLISEMPNPAEANEIGSNYNVGQDVEQRIADLEQELQFSRESLQATVEELETSNEELQATNEELLASNEELQSTNEELQSVNEELYTVNAEFQSKISELTVLNTDMDNLFNSTQIAALFLDENGDIRRFTPKIKEIFPIIDTDVGRPILHFSFDMGGHLDMHQIIARVMRGGETEEHEFRSQDGKWNLLRATPYAINRMLHAGVVLTVIDIDDLKRTQAELLQQMKSESDGLSEIIENSDEAYVQYQPSGKILLWNKGAEKLYGWNQAEALGMSLFDMVPETEHMTVRGHLEHIAKPGSIGKYVFNKLNKQRKSFSVQSVFMTSGSKAGNLVVTSKERCMSHKVVSNDECSICMEKVVNVLSHTRGGVILFDKENIITAWSSGAQQILGWPSQDMQGKSLLAIVSPTEHEAIQQLKQQVNIQSAVHQKVLTMQTVGSEWIRLTVCVEQFSDSQYSCIVLR